MEEIRNIGFVGDTDGIEKMITEIADGPPKGCACQQASTDGSVSMCFMCSDEREQERYNKYYHSKKKFGDTDKEA